MKTRIALVIGTTLISLLAATLPAVASGGEEDSSNRPGTRPANDRIAAALEVAELPFEQRTDMTEAAVEKIEPLPSCSKVTSTIWYQVTSIAEQNLVASAAAAFNTTIAVYSGPDLESLTEVTCATGKAATLTLPATAGSSYLIQVSSVKRHRGPLDFELSVDTWKTKTIQDDVWDVKVPGVDKAAVVIEGAARKTDPKIYDLTVTAADQKIGPYGVETDPVVLPDLKLELLKVPAQQVTVTLRSSYRYDSAQTKCVLWQGETCVQFLPVAGQAGWYTDGGGSEAELVLSLKVEINDRILTERVVAVPFAGQAGALLP